MSDLRQSLGRVLAVGFAATQYFRPKQEGLRVLMYHAIGSSIPEDNLGLYTLTPSVFSAQMKILHDSCQSVIDFVQAATYQNGLAITFDDGYKDALTHASPILHQYQLPFTVFVTSGYVQSGNALYLLPADLKELAQQPMASIGAHGASHVKLTECTDVQLRNELVSSKNYLEDIIQKPVETLSYPHGAVNQKVIDFAVDAGYKVAACSRFGQNSSQDSKLCLKRTDIWSRDNLQDFSAKINGHWDWMEWRT
jgi:peptidoglycan/xylan/chitin deacetylase (PgdA/CDA1 family)